MRKRKTTEEKCAWLMARLQQNRPKEAASVKVEATQEEFPAEMLQKKLTLGEIAKLYQWGYHKTYRFWKDDPRTHVDYKPNPTKAPKMSYRVPKSAVMEEFYKMSSYNQKKRAA